LPTEFVIYGIVAGSAYALIALGFALIYRTVRFFHFAHGAVYTVGAYLAFSFFILLKLPLVVSGVLAACLAGLMGFGMHLLIYKPLLGRGAGSLNLLVASLGILIAVQSVVASVFGSDTKSIRTALIQEGYDILGARITPIQIIILAVSSSLFAVAAVILKYTRIGKVLRAVANDSELALIAGVNKDKVTYFTYFVGSALAAVAAILISLDVDLTPTMGFNALLYGVVAVIIGGADSVTGVYLGAMALGLAQHIGIWKISSKWQDAIAFIILILFLVLKPSGIRGKPSRKVSV
jgi:branched-chain amino acid transport system permease protein